MNDIEKTIAVINQMTFEGVIENYALGGTIVRVITPEYLVAIILDTGRVKDFLRIGFFLQHEVVNLEELQRILNEHGLAEKWRENINKFQI
jgi:hypothetical protein